MAIYDDILKKMQSNFMANSPQRMGQPGGFIQPTFNFGDDDPMGGDNPAGGQGGNDNPVGGGTGSTGSTGGSSYSPTTYGGTYTSNFSSIEDILSSIGQSGFNLMNPASQLGYSQYADLFGTFDTAGYQQASQALMDTEARLLGEIGQQFQSSTGELQGGLQDTLLNMMGEESVTGLVGGRQAQRRQLTRAGAESQLFDLGERARSQYSSAQESIGAQMGQLEGTLLDFINQQKNVALNILSSGGTQDQGAGTDAGYTGYGSIPKGSSMTAQQLESYSGKFSDLGNATAAFQYFVSQAHSNLTDAHLNQLANDVYNMYQNMDESGGT
tara:strand:+ start:1265 stop:2245 length:981 start_codon:yes stop_codon:yes gene_type:complete